MKITKAVLIGLVVTLYSVAPTASFALDTDRLSNPAQETRARALMQDLRCLVCQNESIAESDADLAADLRTVVRQHIAAGETDIQVKHFLVSRYGDWVLLKPPLKATTWVLWAGPVLVLLMGLVMVMRRSPAKPQEVLSETERLALDRLGPH